MATRQTGDVQAGDERRSDESGEADAHETLDPEEQDREEADSRASYLASLSQRVETEPVDMAFRREKEPAINQLIPQYMGSGVTVAEATCASTLCRVKLEHKGSPRIPDEKIHAFATHRGPLDGMEIQFDARTPGVTTLYFLRGEPEAPPEAR